MESEGPYFHHCGTPGERSNCKACAYAEGRKSAEKDFKELLELANNLADVAADDVTPFPEIRKFDAWKKARGIE